MPFPKVEDGRAALHKDAQHTERRGSVAAGQLADLGGIRRNF